MQSGSMRRRSARAVPDLGIVIEAEWRLGEVVRHYCEFQRVKKENKTRSSNELRLGRDWTR